MSNKRPPDEEESYLIPCNWKHPRQLTCSNQQASFVEPPSDNVGSYLIPCNRKHPRQPTSFVESPSDEDPCVFRHIHKHPRQPTCSNQPASFIESPFDEEYSCVIPCTREHPRQPTCTNQPASFAESLSDEDGSCMFRRFREHPRHLAGSSQLASFVELPSDEEDPCAFRRIHEHPRQLPCSNQLASLAESPSDEDDSCVFRHIHEHPRQLACSNQLASSAKSPSDEEDPCMFRHIHEQPRQLACSNQLDSFAESLSDEDGSCMFRRIREHPRHLAGSSQLASFVESPSDEDDPCVFRRIREHPRQLACSNQLASFVESVPHNDFPQKPYISVGEGEGGFDKSVGEEKLASTNVTELAIGVNEFVTSAAVCTSFAPWFSEHVPPTRTLVLNEETYSSLFDVPPRKLVSVGPDHQADVPVWAPSSIMTTSGCLDVSDSHLLVDGDSRENVMGTCVIPMPDSQVLIYNADKDGNCTINCSCEEAGSIRCVRQHIVEQREKLRGTLGQDMFMELGFCDMGEEVARKWHEEEEQVFNEVVSSHPASLRRNFWEHLPKALPSRTKKELVSYYFNVFMLRKRAEQNRLDPLNIDSDNDEWLGCVDGDGDYDCGTSEEDEDSVVDSPVDYDEDHKERFHDDGEGSDQSNNNSDEGNVGVDAGPYDVLEACNGKLSKDCSFDTELDHFGKNPENHGDGHDVQDDSCTSYECQPNKADSGSSAVVVAAKQEH